MLGGFDDPYPALSVRPFCLFIAVVLPSVCCAQSASVGGGVRDQSEAIVTQAKVTLLNTQTGISRQATTNDEGLFWFTSVSPGAYSIAIERDGFKSLQIPDLTLPSTNHSLLKLTSNSAPSLRRLK